MNKFFNTLLASIAVFWVFAVLSIPAIDEKCLACDERVDPYGTAVSLRKLSIVDWLFDRSGDIHLNYHCPNKFVADNNARGAK